MNGKLLKWKYKKTTIFQTKVATSRSGSVDDGSSMPGSTGPLSPSIPEGHALP